MFNNTKILLLQLLLCCIVFWTKGQDCQSLLACNTSCKLDDICNKIYCSSSDSCYHNFSCETSESVSWCTVHVNSKLTRSLINITFESRINMGTGCTMSGCTCGIMCCYSGDRVTPINCSTLSTYPVVTSSSQSHDLYYIDSTLQLITTSLSAVSSVLPMEMHSLSSTSVPSNIVPVTSTITTVIVLASVGTTLLGCLMVAAVFCSILALVLCKTKTKKKQFPVTDNSDPTSQQRIDNIYYSSAAQITDLSSTDGVYSKLDREETTTEIPHHLNTPALPTYSSLADVQQNTSNIEDLPLNYDMVRLENVSGSKTGVVDPCSSLAEDIQKSTSTVKELPQNYDMVRLENISETKTSGVIDQDSAEVIRVQPAAVYSTVVRQNGKKMTVKLDIYP